MDSSWFTLPGDAGDEDLRAPDAGLAFSARVGLLLLLVPAFAFFFTAPNVATNTAMWANLAIMAVRLVLVAWCLAALHEQHDEARVIRISLAMACASVLLGAGESVLYGQDGGSIVLATALVLGAGGFVPWGFIPQVILCLTATLAIGGAVYHVHRGLPPALFGEASGLLVSMVISCVLAYFKRRDRLRLMAFHAQLGERDRALRGIAGSVNDAVYLWDRDRGIARSNKRLASRLGYSASGLAPTWDAWLDLIHPDDKEPVVHQARAALAEGRSRWTSRYRLRARDGGYVPMVERAEVIVNDGVRLQIAGAITDVSDHEILAAKDSTAERHQAALADVLIPMQEGWDVGRLFAHVLEVAATALRLERAGIMLFAADRRRLHSVITYEASAAFWSAGHVVDCMEAPGYFDAIQRGVPINAMDALIDRRTADLAEYLAAASIRSVLDVPLYSLGRIAGLLCLGHAGEPRKFTPEEETFAVAVAGVISIHLENVERSRSEAHSREVLELSPDAILIHRDLVVEFANQAAVDLLVRAEDGGLVGRSLLEFVPADDHSAFAQVANRPAQNIAGGASPTAYFRLLGADGDPKDVEIRVGACRYGRGPAIQMVVRDITVRMREAYAERERAWLAALAGQLGAVLTRGDEIAVMLAQCAHAIFSVLGVLGARIWLMNPRSGGLDLIGLAGVRQWQSRDQIPVSGDLLASRVARRRAAITFADMSQETNEGVRRWLVGAGVSAGGGYPLMVEDRLLGVLVVLDRQPLSADVDTALRQFADAIAVGVARKENEQQLLEARIAADAGNRAKSVFLATMSHEIRTPLNGVLGMAELLANTALNDRQRGFVQVIEECGRSLHGVISDVLDFSKIDAGSVALDLSPVPLHAVLSEASAPVSGAAAAKRVDLLFEIGDAVPSVLVTDHVRLRQVLVNLIANAVKFTHAGTVKVVVSSSAPAGGRCRVRFAVEDTGVGIEASQMEHLFDPFRQGDASTTRHFGGTGLGLAIAKAQTALLGGSIRVVSTIGKGSVFSFDIDAGLADDSVNAATSAATAMRMSRGLRVLVVDDAPFNQIVAAEMLKLLGHEPEVVGGGADAIARAREEHFDIIFMDIVMPGMDGLTAAAAILGECPAEHTPVIVALTAETSATEREACRSAGMRGFLTKPLSVQALARTLRDLLPPEEPAAEDVSG